MHEIDTSTDTALPEVWHAVSHLPSQLLRDQRGHHNREAAVQMRVIKLGRGTCCMSLMHNELQQAYRTLWRGRVSTGQIEMGNVGTTQEEEEDLTRQEEAMTPRLHEAVTTRLTA